MNPPADGSVTLAPDLLWQDGRFHAGKAVEIGRDGRIASVRDAATGQGRPGEIRRLQGRALLPGFVNAHSHAFQRVLRGRTHWRPADADPGDFWTWREAMYSAVLGMDEEAFAAATRASFAEMLRAGFTTVGEFHYVHRGPDGHALDPPERLSRLVMEAAEATGIRLALLPVAYAAGGIDRPLEDRQRRFATPDLAAFLETLDRLREEAASRPGVTVGAAPHSIRAVPRGWLRPIADWAEAAGAPMHMHVSEQPAEVEASRSAYGSTPIEVLRDEGALSTRFTAIHATHLFPGEAEALSKAGATVCACPTTERDLADGFLPVSLLRPAGVPIALGTDSNAVIDPLEEMRCVEYHERLRTGRRVVLAEPGVRADGGPPDRLENAPVLLDMATRHGAGSLGVDAGAIEAGRFADLVAVDLSDPTLEGCDAASLAAHLVFHARPSVVREVWVGGRRVDVDADRRSGDAG